MVDFEDDDDEEEEEEVIVKPKPTRRNRENNSSELHEFKKQRLREDIEDLVGYLRRQGRRPNQQQTIDRTFQHLEEL